jgi:hypothetical protein
MPLISGIIMQTRVRFIDRVIEYVRFDARDGKTMGARRIRRRKCTIATIECQSLVIIDWKTDNRQKEIGKRTDRRMRSENGRIREFDFHGEAADRESR